MTVIDSHEQFIDAWNALDSHERARLRRLARIGRTDADPELAPLASGYARHQLARPWMRLFWLWFVPGLLMVLGLATRMHPIVIGVVLALGAQAVFAWWSLRRLARNMPD